MMNIRFLKRILLILALMLILISINVGVVNASLQSNPNTQYKKKDILLNWMKNIRNMETVGETMGLSEVLNSDLTASSESNGIDVHMIRSTEYGATVILSASAYGNPSNEQAITTTTGNDTGVILNTSNWEWVAGGVQGNIFSGTNGRYYDTYTTSQTSARVGDALGNSTTSNPGCTSWHSAPKFVWFRSGRFYLLRGLGGVFSFSDNGENSNVGCRGVAVCGGGL